MPDYTFYNVFFGTFEKLFDLVVNHPLHFPWPIGNVTIFDFMAFYAIAQSLSMLINLIISRRGDDT